MMSDEELAKLDIDGLSYEEALEITLSILEHDREIHGKRALKSGILFAIAFLAFLVTLARGWTIAEYVFMAIGMMIGSWAFENIWMFIRIPAIGRQLREGSYKMKPREIIRIAQEKKIEKLRKVEEEEEE